LIVSRVREAQAKSVHTVEQREDFVQRVEQAIFDDDQEAIRSVILQGTEDERTFDKLLAAVADPVVYGQTTGSAAFVYALSLFLSCDDEMSRCRAAFALGKMGQHAQSAVPILQKTIDESDEGVSHVAREALAAIQRANRPWWRFW
jgi:HEAT repeat protein